MQSNERETHLSTPDPSSPRRPYCPSSSPSVSSSPRSVDCFYTPAPRSVLQTRLHSIQIRYRVLRVAFRSKSCQSSTRGAHRTRQPTLPFPPSQHNMYQAPSRTAHQPVKVRHGLKPQFSTLSDQARPSTLQSATSNSTFPTCFLHRSSSTTASRISTRTTDDMSRASIRTN